MRISLIVAMDKHGLIGTADGLPWHLPADLKRFRKLTTGKPIIMGRKTYQHINRPLPDRLNIVVSRQPDFIAPGCLVALSIPEAMRIAMEASDVLGTDEIFVIGGANVYRQALPFVERFYLTIVEGEFSGNTWFQDLSKLRVHVVQEDRIPADEKNLHAHRFLILDRVEEGVRLVELLL